MPERLLEAGERELGSWILAYLPPGGGRYRGSLLVTDKRALFRSRFDIEIATLVSSSAASMLDGSDAVLVFPRSEIRSAEAGGQDGVTHLVVTMHDDSIHIFDSGVVPVRKIADALAP